MSNNALLISGLLFVMNAHLENIMTWVTFTFADHAAAL